MHSATLDGRLQSRLAKEPGNSTVFLKSIQKSVQEMTPNAQMSSWMPLVVVKCTEK